MPDYYPATVLLTHDEALYRILALTKADPSTVNAVSEVLRLRAPEILTLKQASARFATCSRKILNLYESRKLPAVDLGRPGKRRLLFYVHDLVKLFPADFSARHNPAAPG